MKIIDINGIERDVKSAAPDPDYPGFVKVEFKRHHEWMSFDEFSEKNPDKTSILKKTVKPPTDVVGTATSAAKQSLTDSTQAWKKDVYVGMTLWISRGLGEGQKYPITKNTKTTITISQPWKTKPDKTSQYVITREVQDSVRAMGNTLPQEDMKSLEKQALKMDRERHRLTSEFIKNNIKYLKPEEL